MVRSDTKKPALYLDLERRSDIMSVWKWKRQIKSEWRNSWRFGVFCSTPATGTTVVLYIKHLFYNSGVCRRSRSAISTLALLLRTRKVRVQISALRLAVLRVHVVFPSSYRQILGLYSGWASDASCHAICNSLFNNLHLIWRCTIWVPGTVFKSTRNKIITWRSAAIGVGALMGRVIASSFT